MADLWLGSIFAVGGIIGTALTVRRGRSRSERRFLGSCCALVWFGALVLVMAVLLIPRPFGILVWIPYLILVPLLFLHLRRIHRRRFGEDRSP